MIIGRFVLFVIAWVLRPVAAVFNFFYVIISNVKKFQFINVMSVEAENGALNIDHFGGAQYAPLWNWLFIKKGSEVKFGDIRFPMSFIFGRLQHLKDYTKLGKVMVSIIDLSDFNKEVNANGGHCAVSYAKHIDTFKMLQNSEVKGN